MDWLTTIEKLPDHLITLTVAVKNFDVSKATLNRAIKKGGGKSGGLRRYGTKSQIKVDAVEVAKLWPKR